MPSAASDDPPPAVRMSVTTLGIPFFTHLLGLASIWAALKQLQILWICDDVLGPETPGNVTSAATLALFNGTNNTVTSLGGQPPHLLDRCDAPEVQATASEWFTIISLCYNVPSLVLVPIFGYFLDRWSRKRIIIVAMSFSVIHTLSMLFITYYHLQLAAAQLLLPALAIATLVHGMGGGRHVIVMSIFALVADVTTRQERTTYIARFESILLGSFTLGPLMGGIMVKVFNSNIPPLYFSIALDIFTIGWFIFMVPETMPQARGEGAREVAKDLGPYQRLPDTEVAEETVAAIVAQGNIVPEDDGDGLPGGESSDKPPQVARQKSVHESILRSIFAPHNQNRSLLVVILLILNLASGGVMFFFVLYTRAHFGWKAYEDGIYSFLSSASKIFALTLILPMILKKFQDAGIRGYEVWMVRFGLLMYVVALYLYGVAAHGWGFLLITSFIDSFGSSLAGPTIRSLVSTSTAANRQGRVLSVVAFVEAIAALIAPLIFGPLYAQLVKAGNERWAFWICGAGCALAWVVSWFMRADRVQLPVSGPLADEEVADGGETLNGHGVQGDEEEDNE